MGRAVLAPAAGILLVGPTVLAFFAGGYFDEPRLVAALVAWALVLVVVVASPRPLPVSRGGRAAVAGLAVLCAWTAASIAWAPLAGPATDSTQRLLLYLGTLVAAIALLRDRAVARLVEPVFALGISVVIGYGLAGRLLPGIVELERSWAAGGRLERPLTYWNAEGLLAAIGLVLCARLAGDRTRSVLVRAAAAAACAPLGAGIYLSYSRGAIAAGIVGLVVLVAAAATRPQLRAAGTAIVAGVVTAAASAVFRGVAALEGTRAERIADGLAMLAILLAVMVAAGALTAVLARREQEGRLGTGRLGLAPRLPALAAVAVALTGVGLVVGGLGERADAARLGEREGPARLTSVSSRRYDYWRIGLQALGRDPLRGTGAGGFRVVWVEERPVNEGVLEVHSLELETALELGVVGMLGLALLLGGTGAAARVAMRRSPAVAAGPVAACTVWIVHATIDWDWQVPAVTLPVLVMAGLVVAVAEASPRRRGTVTVDGAPARESPVPPPLPAQREIARPAGFGA
jgi:hypothetical protein